MYYISGIFVFVSEELKSSTKIKYLKYNLCEKHTCTEQTGTEIATLTMLTHTHTYIFDRTCLQNRWFT